MELTPEQYKRLMKYLQWSIDTFVWQNNATGLNIQPSPELQDAINLREELKA